MIIIVDDVKSGESLYISSLLREGVPATALTPCDFGGWVTGADVTDVDAVDAVLLGGFGARKELARLTKKRSTAAVIAYDAKASLEETLELFAAGVDDVVGDPCDAREILARVAAILRRMKSEGTAAVAGIEVFRDGREPIVGGQPLSLPRRELRILEYLVAHAGRRVTKAQIFSSVYGLFESDIDDNVVESHVSKLRKRLRARLGYDPVDTKRHLGYMIGNR
ncbi:MAG: two-component system response regulator [Alphaproteobacteria bacterium BRH_c36]|nr:MAG: two-component system response regulator [Alphaproteobacteria bacterium BRH_c36]